MKEQIENLISKWSDDAEFYMTQQQKSELAERLDKAIGIDSVLLEEIVKQTLQHNINHQLGLMGMSKNVESISLLDSIIQSRPLKCEVGE
jgi:predicted Zn-dependent protease